LQSLRSSRAASLVDTRRAGPQCARSRSSLVGDASGGERAPLPTFGVINATDDGPARVQTSGGCDSKVHDPRGRMVYAKAMFRF
jgi:hypothetical protein